MKCSFNELESKAGLFVEVMSRSTYDDISVIIIFFHINSLNPEVSETK